MAKNKQQLIEEAQGLGLNVEDLPQDGQDGPSVQTLTDAIAATTGEVPVSVETFIAQGEASLNVPIAGLLVDEPQLRGRELKPSEWQAALDAYLKSERS